MQISKSLKAVNIATMILTIFQMVTINSLDIDRKQHISSHDMHYSDAPNPESTLVGLGKHISLA